MKNTYNKITLYFTLLVFACILVGCEGFQEQYIALDIEVENVDPIIVMNAEIEKDSIVWIQISYSEDINALAETPIRYEENAMITIETASGTSENLNYLKNGLYVGSSILGEVNETYTLSVDFNGQIYTATTTMFPEPGFQDAWVKAANGEGKETSGATYYSEHWIVNDPSDARNHYLFEWYTNGIHIVRIDWCIDDNRVVNANEGLRLSNPTISPGANEHLVFRAAEIDKPTYNYYNMYEKIVRGSVGASSQTPYNPTSNFGEGTMGNFRAVNYSSITVITPPDVIGSGQDEQIILSFPNNKSFTKYNLYWSNSSGVTKDNANIITDIDIYSSTSGSKDDGSKETSVDSYLTFLHSNLINTETYFYRIEVEDAQGNVSVLSPEVGASPDSNVPADDNPDLGGGKNVPTNVVAVTGNNIGEIIISWDGTVNEKISYGIYWNNSSGVDSNLPRENQIWSGKDTNVSSPFTMTGLTSGETYYFKIAVWDGSKVSMSEEVNASAR